MYKLALFDIDGTLVGRNSNSHRMAFIKAYKTTYNVAVEDKPWNYPGWTDQQIMWDTLTKEGLTGAQIKEGLEKFITEAVAEFLKLLPNDAIWPLAGVPELLYSLKENCIVTGLVTGNLEGIAYEKMKKVGLGSYFKIGGFGSDAKDREDLVKIAIERASFYRPFGLEEVCLFGDTPRDIKAAKENGITAIGVATGKYSVEELKQFKPHYIFENLSNTQEVMAVINQQPF